MTRKTAFYLCQETGFSFDRISKRVQLMILVAAGKAEAEILSILQKEANPKGLPNNE